MNGVKAQGASLTRMRTRIGAFVLAIIVALSMAAMTPLSAYAAELQISVDKTASALDDNNQSQVNLKFTGTTDKTYSDVVFVFDKSTSTDVRDAAKSMLTELLSRAGNNKIKVGVVVFNKTASELLPLTELNSDTVATINNALEATPEGGTNIDAGLQAGKEMLDGDTSVSSNAKHLVLVTDGVTYLYGTGETPQTIYTESPANGEETINAGNDMYTAYNSPVNNLTSSDSWYSAYGATIAEAINLYGHDYTSGQYKADVPGQTIDSTYKNAGFEEGDYVAGEDAKDYPTANEAGVYSAMNAWKSVVSQGYKAYAFADDKYESTHPWGAAFVSTLSTLGGGTSGMVPTDTTGMFDAVQSDILYALGEGSTVTDVMGSGTTDQGEEYNFDFVNDINKIDISVDGTVLDKVAAGENTYNFTKDGADYFTLKYDPSGDLFTLAINTPIAGNDVVVSYYVDLVKAPTIPGDYKLDTNNSAVLTPAGDFDDLVFPVPTVTYTVEETPVTPTDPGDGDNTNTNNNTQTVNVNTGTDGKASSLPQTSDNTMPFVVGLIALVALAGGAGIVAWRKSH